MTAAEMLKHAASPVSAHKSGPPVGDGEQWHKSVDLVDNCYACHRSTGFGSEFAVVEQTPPNQIDEVLVRGRNPVEVLRIFGRDRRQALQLWTDDVAAQVKEQLVEKYPGQDLRRVADAIVHRFTQLNLPRHVIKPNAGQRRSRGIRI